MRTEVRAGRWHQPSAHTVAFFTGALTERQRWWVALLESGCSDAALDGLTALQAAGLTGVEGALVISCCRGSQPRRVPEAEIRITRWRCRHDVVGAGIPRVRPSAASIHAALWAKTERQAALMLVAPVQQRLIPPDRLARELARIRRHPKRSWVGQAVHDIVDGAQALGELDFAGLCRRRGWPSPSRQVVRRGPRGRWYLDVSFDEYGVVVEIDGIQHGQGLGPVDDALRQNALAMAGDIVLRIRCSAFASPPTPSSIRSRLRSPCAAGGGRPDQASKPRSVRWSTICRAASAGVPAPPSTTTSGCEGSS